MNYMEGIYIMIDSMYKPHVIKEPFVYTTSLGDTFAACGHEVKIQSKDGGRVASFGSERAHHEVSKEIHDALYREYKVAHFGVTYNKPAGKVDLRKRRWK